MRKTATLDDLAEWRPCWGMDDARIQTLAGKRKRFNSKQLTLLRGSFPEADWQWLAVKFLLHCGKDKVVYEFASRCSRHALEAERAAGREPDPRSWAAVEASLGFSQGTVESAALSAARSGALCAVSARSADGARDR